MHGVLVSGQPKLEKRGGRMGGGGGLNLLSELGPRSSRTTKEKEKRRSENQFSSFRSVSDAVKRKRRGDERGKVTTTLPLTPTRQCSPGKRKEGRQKNCTKAGTNK